MTLLETDLLAILIALISLIGLSIYSVITIRKLELENKRLINQNKKLIRETNRLPL